MSIEALVSVLRPEAGYSCLPNPTSDIRYGPPGGVLATKLYPAGLYVTEDYLHHQKAQKATDSAIGNPNVPAIFEGSFVYDDIRLRVGILARLKNGR
jgi:hypothetical protein